ncbi:MAG: hypothetical protein ACSW8C_03360 [bacterium]
MRSHNIVPIFIIAGLLSGCFRSKREQIAFLQAEYSPKNVSYRMSTGSILRVVVAPLFNYGAEISDEDLKKVENSFKQALLKKGCFECIFEKNLPFIDYAREIPNTLFEKLMKQYDADAILFMGVTQYSPYTPIQLGARMQLIELSSNKIIWGIDEIFDASAEKVYFGVKHYQRAHTLNSFETLNDLGQLSPEYFSAYVGQKIYETIPESF